MVVLLFNAITAAAVTHVINFGGALGNNYSPNTLTVNVGDTITWMGTFSSHPLEATMRPSGAAPFGTGSGTSYSYPVTVAGDYAYRCTFHFASGMTGTFTAVAVSTDISEAASPDDVRVMPSLTHDVVNVMLASPSGNKVSAEIVNADGKRMAEAVLISGTSAQLDFTPLAAGTYFVIVRSEQGIISAKKVMKK